MDDCIFSILMCARNAEKTIERAIDSVREQTCQDWELIIVDNASTDSTWELITRAGKEDSRIKSIHLDRGIGWANGAGLCLEHSKGKYMTFLAADDFLLGDGCLETVKKYIIRERPDIVWTGHILVRLMQDNSFQVCGGVIPKYEVYTGTDKINEIFDIMNQVYYNSFFHYISIDLLRLNHINFCEPFWADCEGVTEAMCRASKMVTVSHALYALTENTSQTRGSVDWRHNTVQWGSIKRTILEDGTYNKETLRYIAMKIMQNNLSMLISICSGDPVRDEEMNLVDKTPLERMQFVEEELASPEFVEMFYYTMDELNETLLLDNFRNLLEQCIQTGYSPEEIAENLHWLDLLVWGFYEFDQVEKKLVRRNKIDAECMKKIKVALCSAHNPGMMGMKSLVEILSGVTQDCRVYLDEIQYNYVNYCFERKHELLYMAKEMKKRGRMPEVLTIIEECKELLCVVKNQISENDFMEHINELKEVGNLS